MINVSITQYTNVNSMDNYIKSYSEILNKKYNGYVIDDYTNLQPLFSHREKGLNIAKIIKSNLRTVLENDYGINILSHTKCRNLYKVELTYFNGNNINIVNYCDDNKYNATKYVTLYFEKLHTIDKTNGNLFLSKLSNQYRHKDLHIFDFFTNIYYGFIIMINRQPYIATIMEYIDDTIGDVIDNKKKITKPHKISHLTKPHKLDHLEDSVVFELSYYSYITYLLGMDIPDFHEYNYGIQNVDYYRIYCFQNNDELEYIVFEPGQRFVRLDAENYIYMELTDPIEIYAIEHDIKDLSNFDLLTRCVKNINNKMYTDNTNVVENVDIYNIHTLTHYLYKENITNIYIQDYFTKIKNVSSDHILSIYDFGPSCKQIFSNYIMDSISVDNIIKNKKHKIFMVPTMSTLDTFETNK